MHYESHALSPSLLLTLTLTSHRHYCSPSPSPHTLIPLVPQPHMIFFTFRSFNSSTYLPFNILYFDSLFFDIHIVDIFIFRYLIFQHFYSSVFLSFGIFQSVFSTFSFSIKVQLTVTFYFIQLLVMYLLLHKLGVSILFVLWYF
jgi:hypothetical protein